MEDEGSKSEVEDLKEFLKEDKEIEEKEATVIYDKTQFSIRIPKKFARMFNLKGGEKFVFRPEQENNKIILKGELKDGINKV